VSGEPRVEILDDAAAVSGAAAELIARALAGAVAVRGRADWSTTGGSTPTGIYKALARQPLRDAVPWEAVHVWWGDDRFVPRDHPLSNVLPLDQVLISASARSGQSGTGEDSIEVELGLEPGVPLPAANIHAPPMGRAIAASTGPEAAAREYEAELRAAGLATSDAGFPILDVILVGIGPDGHLFSVFPNSRLFDAEHWVEAVPAPTHIEPKVARISLHPRILDAARLPVVVVHGAGKAEAVRSVLAGERDERRLPAQVARRSGAVWLLDRAAAASLPPSLAG
jgi:6-phosphogluconolactonase